jgi:hypothetical protein
VVFIHAAAMDYPSARKNSIVETTGPIVPPAGDSAIREARLRRTSDATRAIFADPVSRAG